MERYGKRVMAKDKTALLRAIQYGLGQGLTPVQVFEACRRAGFDDQEIKAAMRRAGLPAG